MNIFKKILLVVMVFTIAMFITGCGKESSKNVEGTLEEIMEKIYKNLPDDKKPGMLGDIEVNDENIEGFLGSSDIEYTEALAREPGITSIAHSVVLVRVKDGADIEKVKTTIKEKVNPRKWLCVGVEREDLIVKNKGNLVILIMVENEETRTKLEEGFDNL